MLRNFAISLLTLSLITGVRAKCGQPDLPRYATIAKEHDSEYYEEGSRLKLMCAGGAIVFPDVDRKRNWISCENGSWTPSGSVCSQAVKIDSDAIRFGGGDQIKFAANVPQPELKIITDNKADTCAMKTGSVEWTLQFERPIYLSHVTLLIANSNRIHNVALFDISTSGPSETSAHRKCHLASNFNTSSMPLVMLVYHCEFETSAKLTLNLLAPSGTAVGICDLELFIVDVDDCGKPARPLFSTVNLITDQSGDKIANYNCLEGYQLTGVSQRVCGSRGAWLPPETPVCAPQVTCPLNISHVTQELTVQYGDLDLNGRAIAGLAWRRFECKNVSLMVDRELMQTCRADGTWTGSSRPLPSCIDRPDYLHYNHVYMRRSRVVVAIILGCLALFFLTVAVVTISTRKSLMKLQEQLRQAHYRNSKVLPSSINDPVYEVKKENVF